MDKVTRNNRAPGVRTSGAVSTRIDYETPKQWVFCPDDFSHKHGTDHWADLLEYLGFYNDDGRESLHVIISAASLD